MFDFLKKKQEPIKSQDLIVATQSVLETVANTKNYPKEVLEIHHEFQIASETLLMTAKSIIDEASTKDCQKVDRLEKLGFKQAGQVTEIKPLMQKAELSKEQIELVKYYQREYPLHKFITEEQVKAICHKWNLVCGDVSRFKGFVPEKNLRDIERFNLKENEYNNTLVHETYNGRDSIYKSYPISYIAQDNKLNITETVKGILNESICPYSGKYILDNALKICAPVKDMDISGLELEDGYKLIKKHVPDPVVLQPVKGGFLLVTCWGDEASDPICVNEKFN